MSNWYNPRYQRECANRRRHVKYDAWPGDIYYIPLAPANYLVGSDGNELILIDAFAETYRRLNLTRIPND